jgi:hypothetical protein
MPCSLMLIPCCCWCLLLPPGAQMGVYAVYEGQQPQASDAELQQLRNNLPALPPSLFGINASCSCCRTAEQVVQKYGAVHGQRVKGEDCGVSKVLQHAG